MNPFFQMFSSRTESGNASPIQGAKRLNGSAKGGITKVSLNCLLNSVMQTVKEAVVYSDVEPPSRITPSAIYLRRLLGASTCVSSLLSNWLLRNYAVRF